jgi:Leucine-rich repeat (LRR) protein
MLSSLKSLAIFNKTFDGLDGGDLDGLDNVEELSIEDNEITHPTLYKGIFDNLLKLESLWLFGNGLTILREDVFKNNVHLIDISLADNALTELHPKLFSTLTKLDGLSLNDNNLTSIPQSLFEKLTKLTYLRLSGNKIETFESGTFKDLAVLRTLYLENNNISVLPTGIFKGLKKLKSVDLRGNPGSPFNVSVNLVSNPQSLLQYRAICYYHAPFELKLKITVGNGHAVAEGTNTRTKYLTINAGEKTSTDIYQNGFEPNSNQ